MNNEEWCKKNCPYYPDCSGGGACNYVISLLKEQEPVKAVADGEDYRCNNCGTLIGWTAWEPGGIEKVKYKFCPECGRSVKWDE